MYNGTQLRHLARESLHGLLRRRIAGAVAVLIMGSSLLMLALFSLITINLDRLLQDFRREIDMEIFLAEDIHADDRERLQEDVAATAGVTGVRYVSAEDALAQFRVDLADDVDLLEALEANPLPASLRIRLDANVQDAERLDELAATVREYPGVDEVIVPLADVARYDWAAKVFLVVAVVVGLLVLMSALFVISNTVRLTIEESAAQVEIMKLVGATNAFIRTPFLLNGALQGAAAGGLAMFVLSLAVRAVEEQIGAVAFFHTGQLLGFVLLSTLLGAGGSALALRRHLRL